MTDDSGATTVETAEYIAGLVKELRALASRSRLDFLAFLLSMAEQEADRIAAGEPPSSGS